MEDLRDQAGRLRHVVLATLMGIVGSVAVTFLLPTRDHFPLPPGSCGNEHRDQGWLVEGGSPSLMIAGAIALALAAYAVLRRLKRST